MNKKRTKWILNIQEIREGKISFTLRETDKVQAICYKWLCNKLGKFYIKHEI